MRSFALILIFSFLATLQASALSVDWSGSYRLETQNLSSSFLGGNTADVGAKSYFLNHLNLTPKIIPLDGVKIISNIEVFPSSRYPGSELGGDFGAGTANSASYPSSAMGQGTMSANYVEVNQLYMTWNQEFGELVAGRMPLQFGLGISHSAGNGVFDHWIETHDLVGYKVLFGNLSITPMLGRLANGYGFAAGAQGTEEILHIDYTNPETESTFAIMHQIRNAGPAANDAANFFAPYEGTQTTGNPQVSGGLNTTLTNIYFARGWESLKLRVEAGFTGGNTGVSYNSYVGEIGSTQPAQGGSAIAMSGYGFATELEYANKESRWDDTLRMGIASGDNPQTQNFEGFFFDRNYNIALLLFNQPMGQYDVLRTALGHQRIAGTSFPYSNYAYDRTADEEYLSNAYYFSPKFVYKMSDSWLLVNTLTAAWTQTNPSYNTSNVANDLGYEYDIGVTYKPHPRFQWVNTIGAFLPGAAWQEGSVGWTANFVWGWESKFGITF